MYEYCDAHFVVNRTIDFPAAAANENYEARKDVAFRNNASFRSFISKINNSLIDNVDSLDIVMLMYNLLEYSEISGVIIKWNYHKDEIDGDNDNASQAKLFEYKTKITGKTPP